MLKLNIRSAKIFIMLCIAPMVFAQDLERREITPPKLNAANLGKHILCHRPVRQGKPQMSIQQISGKTIVNDYGHGESGWTLGPGSAKYNF